MKDLEQKLTDLARRLDRAETVLQLDKRRQEIKELEASTTAEGFWNDREQAEVVMKELGGMQKSIEPWEIIETDLGDLTELARATAPEDHSSIIQITAQLDKLGLQFEKREFELLMNGEYDDHDAILSVYSGAGGTDAQDWAEMLLKMYTKFAMGHKFTTELLHVSSGEEAGIKSATLRVSGPYAYGYLRGEGGVHRLVRISPFDADNARHTSFALIDVMPDIGGEIDLEIDPKDLKIDVFRAGGHGGQSVNTTDSAVRLTHLPTGVTVSVQNERSQLQNKNRAMGILKGRLYQFMKQRRAEKLDEIRGQKVAVEWGSQIRSYVLHPYTKVKDHRTDYETSQTDKVLLGDLMPLIEAYLRWSAKSAAA